MHDAGSDLSGMIAMLMAGNPEILHGEKLRIKSDCLMKRETDLGSRKVIQGSTTAHNLIQKLE